MKKIKKNTLLLGLLWALSGNVYGQMTIQAAATLKAENGLIMTIEGDLNNAGLLSGDGTLTIDGDFINSGDLGIALGASLTTVLDLEVGGQFIGGGKFVVDDSNYTPQAGDQVEVISASKEITNPFLNQVSNDWFANYNTPNLGSFTISYLAALPVELLDFYGRLEGKAISLDWSTASEVNNLGFTIQRSQDTRNWTQLAFVAGVGNSTVLQSYEYWDRFPRPGINYYRLQQMDDNGEVHYSKVISVAFAMELQAMHIHPNPSIEWVQLDWPLPTEKEIAIQLLDQRGLVVLRTQLERGQRQLRIDMSNLTAGLYTLHVNEGVRRISKKLVKQGL